MEMMAKRREKSLGVDKASHRSYLNCRNKSIKASAGRKVNDKSNERIKNGSKFLEFISIFMEKGWSRSK